MKLSQPVWPASRSTRERVLVSTFPGGWRRDVCQRVTRRPSEFLSFSFVLSFSFFFLLFGALSRFLSCELSRRQGWESLFELDSVKVWNNPLMSLPWAATIERPDAERFFPFVVLVARSWLYLFLYDSLSFSRCMWNAFWCLTISSQTWKTH